MAGYKPGAAVRAGAEALERQHQHLHDLQEQAKRLQQQVDRLKARIVDDARAESARIVGEARDIALSVLETAHATADRVRSEAANHAAAARMEAEREAALIRERAYLEGRARADQNRLQFDELQAARQRRRTLGKVS
ncbi:hypothetical protein [Zhihengliuella halotolerans]|uniref:hypothetical protein n=1 Tax=Zhihengliuella halotolerans TaxID=370736 RepID=UPI000C80521A|nr:hypothetical protein [Zhihengliuella halotolerans]